MFAFCTKKGAGRPELVIVQRAQVLQIYQGPEKSVHHQKKGCLFHCNLQLTPHWRNSNTQSPNACACQRDCLCHSCWWQTPKKPEGFFFFQTTVFQQKFLKICFAYLWTQQFEPLILGLGTQFLFLDPCLHFLKLCGILLRRTMRQRWVCNEDIRSFICRTHAD